MSISSTKLAAAELTMSSTSATSYFFGLYVMFSLYSLLLFGESTILSNASSKLKSIAWTGSTGAFSGLLSPASSFSSSSSIIDSVRSIAASRR